MCSDGTVAPLPGLKTQRRHVILMIGDGMGYSHQVATSRYLHGTDRGLSFHGFPEQAFVTTHSVSGYNLFAAVLGVSSYSTALWDPVVGYDPAQGGRAPYPFLADTQTSIDYFLPGGSTRFCTDSAAAATAMATGYKTNDGQLSMLPDGRGIETIAETLRRLYGMSMGIVSTVAISHATPGAFLAHSPSRSDYVGIAQQIVSLTRPEVALSAGYTASNTYIGSTNLAVIDASVDHVRAYPVEGQSGAQVLADAAAVAVQDGKGLFGLFGSSSLESPTPVHAPGAPQLVRTSSDPALSDLATAALTVLSQDPEGFFLMVEQGSIDSAAHGNDFPHVIGNTWDLDCAVSAVVDFVDQEGDDIDWTNTTLFVTADHETGYLRLGDTALGQGELPDAAAEVPQVTWGTGTHTNQLVTLSAMGASAHRLSTYAVHYPGMNIVDNTDIHSLLLDSAMR